jgi:hypothetical protein
MLLLASFAVIVKPSVAPAAGVEEAAMRTRWSAAPIVTVAVLVGLAVDHERHLAETTYSYTPGASPLSVQVVVLRPEAQVPLALPPLRLTEYVTVPVAGVETALQVRATVPPTAGVAVTLGAASFEISLGALSPLPAVVK